MLAIARATQSCRGVWPRVGQDVRMQDPTATESPADPSTTSWYRRLNPATLRGGVAVTFGALVLLLPELSVDVAVMAVVAGFLASGAYDIWYGLTGRRHGKKRPSRILALIRAPFALLFAGITVLTQEIGLSLVVGLVGIYIGIRGLLSLGSLLLPGGREDTTRKVAVGLASVGLGVLAFFAPATLTTALLVGTAVAAMTIGGIVLAYGLHNHDDVARIQLTSRPIAEILWDWVRSRDIGGNRRDQLADTLYFEEPDKGSKLLAWWVMLTLSVIIATYAVLQDSTAVVIGAMLVAPLMVPILGLAGAIINGWRHRAVQSGLLIAGGVAAAIALSYAASAWAPVALVFDTNTQITSRVSPSLPDMVIAVAAGAAGAFATVNLRVASSIAGVAIAVALVPPLAVVGISLGAQRYADAGGAMLLFLTNFVAIVLAAAGVFALGGFAQPSRLRERLPDVLTTFAPFVGIAAVILVPLFFTSQGLIATATENRQVSAVVDEWLGEAPSLQVTSTEVRDDEVLVSLRGPSNPPAMEPLQEALIDELGRPVALTVTVVPVSVSQRDLPAETNNAG